MYYLTVYRPILTQRSGWDKLADFFTGRNNSDFFMREAVYRAAFHTRDGAKRFCGLEINERGLVIYLDPYNIDNPLFTPITSREGFTFELEWVADAPL